MMYICEGVHDENGLMLRCDGCEHSSPHTLDSVLGLADDVCTEDRCLWAQDRLIKAGLANTIRVCKPVEHIDDGETV